MLVLEESDCERLGGKKATESRKNPYYLALSHYLVSVPRHDEHCLWPVALWVLDAFLGRDCSVPCLPSFWDRDWNCSRASCEGPAFGRDAASALVLFLNATFMVNVGVAEWFLLCASLGREDDGNEWWRRYQSPRNGRIVAFGFVCCGLFVLTGGRRTRACFKPRLQVLF